MKIFSILWNCQYFNVFCNNFWLKLHNWKLWIFVNLSKFLLFSNIFSTNFTKLKIFSFLWNSHNILMIFNIFAIQLPKIENIFIFVKFPIFWWFCKIFAIQPPQTLLKHCWKIAKILRYSQKCRFVQFCEVLTKKLQKT